MKLDPAEIDYAEQSLQYPAEIRARVMYYLTWTTKFRHEHADFGKKNGSIQSPQERDIAPASRIVKSSVCMTLASQDNSEGFLWTERVRVTGCKL